MIQKAFAQTAVLLTCTMGITFFGVGNTESRKEISLQNEIVSAEEILKVDGVTAGVSSLFHKTAEDPVVLTAGVATSLLDFNSGEVYIVEQEKVKVAAALEEEKKEEEMKQNLSDWGYTNLGIALTDSSLNVRKEPSTGSSIVGKMSNNTACEIVESSDGWAKITSGNVEGYVCLDYVVTGEEAYAIAKEQVETIATVTTSSNLRVRENPSTEAKILSNVSKDEKLHVLDASDGWIKVAIDDEEGYVSADYVSLSEELPTAQTMSELKYGAGVSDVRVDLVSNALQYVGNRYVWGGTSLTNGVDCSGFTMKIYAKYGISLPHSSKAQPGYGTKISASDAQPGDLFFYGSGSTINHVAIYIGGGKIVHASNSRDGIKISNAFYREPICVVSYLN